MQSEYLPGEEIEALVEEIYNIFDNAKTPFNNPDARIVDKEEVLSRLDEVRMNFPEEWNKSRRILREREELLASANMQADAIIADAQNQAITLASDQEIVRLARLQADEIRSNAEQYERDTRYSVEEYADQVLTHLEDNLKNITANVSRCHQMLNDSSGDMSNNISW